MAKEGCRVLVIDDNFDAADSAVMLLKHWGHEALAAYTPQEAISIAGSFDPDVVLIDIGLPGKSGFEVAEELRQSCPSARFIALTGFTQADIVRRSRQQGFSAHFVKPANLADLKSAVDDECGAETRPQKGGFAA